MFGRYGESQALVRRDKFYSSGFQFAQGLRFSPAIVGAWLVADRSFEGGKERLVEAYYNFSLAEKFISLSMCNTS
jgi:hypothetical protein